MMDNKQRTDMKISSIQTILFSNSAITYIQNLFWKQSSWFNVNICQSYRSKDLSYK